MDQADNSRVVNVVTDLLILGLPVQPISRLHMAKTSKIQVIGMFLLGGL